MNIEVVSDAGDPRLAWYRGVGSPRLLDAGTRFVAEGRRVVARLLLDPRWEVESVLVSPAALEALRNDLAARPELPVFLATGDVVLALTGYNIHRGCLAIGRRPPLRTAVELIATLPLASVILGLEAVADADNVGGCFRNAAAFAAGAVIVDEASASPLYRKAIRTSMAAVFDVPFARVASWPEVIARLREDEVHVVGLTPARDAEDLTAADHGLSSYQRRLLLVGNEGGGLSAKTLAACDRRVRIPMPGGVDSLNAATAAAIALYEIATSRPGQPDRGTVECRKAK